MLSGARRALQGPGDLRRLRRVERARCGATSEHDRIAVIHEVPAALASKDRVAERSPLPAEGGCAYGVPPIASDSVNGSVLPYLPAEIAQAHRPGARSSNAKRPAFAVMRRPSAAKRPASTRAAEVAQLRRNHARNSFESPIPNSNMCAQRRIDPHRTLRRVAWCAVAAGAGLGSRQARRVGRPRAVRAEPERQARR